MGITTKRINGTEYLYFTHQDKVANTTKFHSCGVANKKEAQLKAMQLEYARLKQHRAEVDEAMKDIQSKMATLGEEVITIAASRGT